MKATNGAYGVAFLLVCTVLPCNAQAEWGTDCRHLTIHNSIKKETDPEKRMNIGLMNGGGIIDDDDEAIVYIPHTDLANLEAAIRDLKKCMRFHQCIMDRIKGKVKHCYENDRRWRP